ncbi:MAG: hypothetical protein PHP97_03165 [Candidatus Shapirobacteria bacterium]|nr:hypothetical protein [Candidatus Shapirobacteria bacterium]MDD3003119.1 hypothetical protein [Candidatus Shapirobacteria bacterium]MDD4383028.1 hypothetical protein [Candidatus Shapirobacteria bacterium]
MEDINQTDITNQILGNQPTNIPISKSKNIFKLLFFISIFVLLVVIISFYFIILNKKNYQASNNNISQITPTTSVSKSDNLNISAYIKTDNKNSYLVLNKNNEEFIIDTIDKDMWLDEVRFTGSLRYLIYAIKAPGATSIKIYDTKHNSFIKDEESDGFFPQSGPPIITNDENYLIFCSGSDYAGISGGKIISLSDQSVKFDFIKYLGNKIADSSISCSYNSNTNIVSFQYYQGTGGTKDSGVNYNLNTDKFEDWQIDN